MRMLLLAGVALAMSGCGGGNKSTNAAAANSANASGTTMNQVTPPLDMNASGNIMANGSGNAAGAANTQDLKMKDAVTNDPDTNLANGL